MFTHANLDLWRSIPLFCHFSVNQCKLDRVQSSVISDQ
ncbi:hypothetical protein N44_00871 [Microcystis aeruginosa NIES-44]|uniref:Uncharacterized protein n=1 Tax=Microcystis aeruginosa NIES-44 TaxID=449439 RepID=A0A0A1VS99_MICAE|nr:hypothetical protein N44_00871 [Microcystis aeruginosa NIES-44]